MSCPICQNDTVQSYHPFCSRRCADIDLARWINGAYRVASEREDEVDDPIAKDPPQAH